MSEHDDTNTSPHVDLGGSGSLNDAASDAIAAHQRDGTLLRNALTPADELATVFRPLPSATPATIVTTPSSPTRDQTHPQVAFAPIVDVLARLDRGETTSMELTELMLQRINAYDDRVNGYIAVIADRALASAAEADRERSNGLRRPLLGVPIALKDLFDIAEIPTTAGSRILADNVPPADATVVRLLREAGAVLLGKTHMAEFAYGFAHPDYGPSRTPWALSHSASGSSGGSGASVAAGLAYGALGSDTGGSIRSPAAACGITGLKPTFGLVSKHGVVPLSWTLDHVGPMTRSAEDARLMLDVIAGIDPLDPTTVDSSNRPRWGQLQSLSGIRIGLLTDLIDAAEPDVRVAVSDAVNALRAAGAETVEVVLPMPDAINAIAFGTMEPEAASFHARWLNDQPESYAPRTRQGLLAAMAIPGSQYVDAQRLRARFNQQMNHLFVDQRLDLLLAPTDSVPPWPVESPTENESHDDWDLRYTVVANLTGMPALSLPCGFTSDGLPLSLQILAPSFHDDLTLRVGELYQSVTDWHRRVPPGFEG